MADITMCDGNNCSLKSSCYRFKAKPSIRQSYFMKTPYDKKKKSCEYYWNLNNISKETKNILDNN